jgi:phage/plasmid-like protein (TIGR03299 family)
MPISEKQISEVLDKEGLDYTVKTYKEKNPFTGEELPFCGTYRDDNNHVFKTGFSKQYRTIQNRDAFKTLSDLSKVSNVELVRAGSWNNGREAFAQVDFNGGCVVPGGKGGFKDEIANRCTFYNRHDGQSSLVFFITPFRFGCKNQVAAALRRAHAAIGKELRVSHTKSGLERLEELAEQYQIIQGVFKETEENYAQLADCKIGQEHVLEVLNRLYPVKDVSPKSIAVNADAQAKIAGLYEDADGGRVSWDTAWNLYNSVTNYTTHLRGGYSNKERSLLVGTGQQRGQEILEVVNEVCLDNVLSQVDVDSSESASAVDSILSQVDA